MWTLKNIFHVHVPPKYVEDSKPKLRVVNFEAAGSSHIISMMSNAAASSTSGKAKEGKFALNGKDVNRIKALLGRPKCNCTRTKCFTKYDPTLISKFCDWFWAADKPHQDALVIR